MGHNLPPLSLLVPNSEQVNELVGRCLVPLCYWTYSIYIIKNINNTGTYNMRLKELLWSLITMFSIPFSWSNRERIGWFRRKNIKREGIFFSRDNWFKSILGNCSERKITNSQILWLPTSVKLFCSPNLSRQQQQKQQLHCWCSEVERDAKARLAWRMN